MPYIIAVLALVIIGTGYTLFQKETTEPTVVLDTPSSIMATNTPETTSVPEVTTETPLPEATNPTPTEPGSNPTSAPTPTKPNPTNPSTPTPAPAVSKNDYADGTYYATKSYRTPDGTYEMTVGLTIKGDTVTNSTITYDSEGARSSYTKRFNSGYQNQVIGKDLGSINLSRVSGSSLTTAAFNNALSSIKSQAS